MSTRIAITGSGVDAPRDVVSNDELCASFNAWVHRENERRADAIREGKELPLEESSPEFVERVSGIRRRHFWTRTGVLDPRYMFPQIPDRPDEELSVQAELALGAIRRALSAAGREGGEVDLVIVGASSLQRPYPAVAIEVQHALGARGIAYDLSVGCASAGFGIQLASEAIRSGSARCLWSSRPSCRARTATSRIATATSSSATPGRRWSSSPSSEQGRARSRSSRRAILRASRRTCATTSGS